MGVERRQVPVHVHAHICTTVTAALVHDDFRLGCEEADTPIELQPLHVPPSGECLVQLLIQLFPCKSAMPKGQ